ncbi:MAG: hypothetical protein ACTSP5_00880 [Candidatus Heimdallarchaeota archaeon]
MTLKEELSKLATTKMGESTIRIAEQIRKIVESKGEISYQIIMLLTKEKMERGYTKGYTLNELQKKLPWEKSTTIKRLQEVVDQEVLRHEKRKYKLNKENEIVKRIWNYYHETSYQEKEKMKKLLLLTQKKNELERRLAEQKVADGIYKKLTKKEEEEFAKEIKNEARDEYEPKERVMEYLMEIKDKVLGYTLEIKKGVIVQ